MGKSQKNGQGPRYIIYYNSTVSPLDALLDTPYTHVILSFLGAKLVDGHIELSKPSQLEPYWATVPKLQAQGKKVLISFGGGTMQSGDYTPLAGHEPELARAIADYVEEQGLDGVDIDYEASDSFFTARAADVLDGRAFIIALHQELRKALPAPKYSLSHAPQPPYLSASWHGGPYLDILKALAENVDWIGIQYYNNPGFDVPISQCILGQGCDPFATSIAGLMRTPLAWPAHRLVVGKPVYKADAANGHIDPDTLIEDIIDPLLAQFSDQFGGIMGWQFSTHTADHRAWNSTVGKALLG